MSANLGGRPVGETRYAKAFGASSDNHNPAIGPTGAITVVRSRLEL